MGRQQSKARDHAHKAFDEICRKGLLPRQEAYEWLAQRLGIEVSECHMSRMDRNMCRDVVYFSTQLKNDLNRLDKDFGVAPMFEAKNE